MLFLVFSIINTGFILGTNDSSSHLLNPGAVFVNYRVILPQFGKFFLFRGKQFLVRLKSVAKPRYKKRGNNQYTKCPVNQVRIELGINIHYIGTHSYGANGNYKKQGKPETLTLSVTKYVRIRASGNVNFHSLLQKIIKKIITKHNQQTTFHAILVTVRPIVKQDEKSIGSGIALNGFNDDFNRSGLRKFYSGLSCAIARFAAYPRKRVSLYSRLCGKTDDKGDAVKLAIPKGFKIGKL